MKARNLKLLVALITVSCIANANSTAAATNTRINIDADIQRISNIDIPNRDAIRIIPTISKISDISPIAINQPEIIDADIQSIDIDPLIQSIM